MRHQMFPDTPVSLDRNTEVPAPLHLSTFSPPDHARLIGKDSDAGRDWGQEKKETTEDEMAGWHHRLDGREFE